MRVKLSPGAAATLKMMAAWPQRAHSYMGYNLYGFADRVQADVLDRLPSEATELKKSMQMVSVSGASPSYLLRFQPVASTVEKDEQDSVILEVVPKRQLIVPKATKILIDYGPWTLDTLPYTPDRRSCVVLKRKVRAKAVKDVRMLRKLDKRHWQLEMQRAGVRPSRGQKSRVVKAVNDLRLQSVTYEFGLNGVYKPHWRPAISKNLRRFNRVVKKDRQARKIISDPTFKGWKKWPLALAQKISPAGLTPYEEFQKTLGIL